MGKYKNVLCSSLMMILVLCATSVFMAISRDDGDATPIVRITKGDVPDVEPTQRREQELKSLNAILTASARVYQAESDVPDQFWTPCRRLSDIEMQHDDTLEGFKISDITMSMCRILQEQHGPEGEGSFPAKLMNVEPWMNLCILSYKAPDGSCTHLVNPTIVKPVNSTGDRILFRQRYFPYVGRTTAPREPTVMVMYNDPNLEYKSRTTGFAKPQSLFIQDAYDILMGAFPPPKHVHE
jgi:hypothetical protein